MIEVRSLDYYIPFRRLIKEMFRHVMADVSTVYDGERTKKLYAMDARELKDLYGKRSSPLAGVILVGVFILLLLFDIIL